MADPLESTPVATATLTVRVTRADTGVVEEFTVPATIAHVED